MRITVFANDNPTLLKLRLLQALEKSSGNTFFMGMSPPVDDSGDHSATL
ncbi:MAG: hypothetical protein AAFV72_18010 [Cyanobacteria bacterium J06635_1]